MDNGLFLWRQFEYADFCGLLSGTVFTVIIIDRAKKLSPIDDFSGPSAVRGRLEHSVVVFKYGFRLAVKYRLCFVQSAKRHAICLLY